MFKEKSKVVLVVLGGVAAIGGIIAGLVKLKKCSRKKESKTNCYHGIGSECYEEETNSVESIDEDITESIEDAMEPKETEDENK